MLLIHEPEKREQTGSFHFSSYVPYFFLLEKKVTNLLYYILSTNMDFIIYVLDNWHGIIIAIWKMYQRLIFYTNISTLEVWFLIYF